MECERDNQKARSAIRQAAECVADRQGLPLEVAQEWLRRQAIAKRAGLEQVARAVIAEQPLDYQYPGPGQPNGTPC
jgi:AmiR/NasT family two-component response regulator